MKHHGLGSGNTAEDLDRQNEASFTSSTSRRVPDEVRELVGHFEASGEVLPMSRFPKLAEAAQ